MGNSMKQNITQVVAWMKANKFMKEVKTRPTKNKGGRTFRKKNFK